MTFSSLLLQVLPPSCVDHVLSCRVVSEHESADNLVVIKSTVLEIYTVTYQLRAAKTTVATQDPSAANKELLPLLKLFGSFKLSGIVESVSSVRLLGLKKDCLVLAFADAKISIVEFDPTVNDLVTVSLHAYEEEGFKVMVFE